jgi:hypothetical protein
MAEYGRRQWPDNVSTSGAVALLPVRCAQHLVEGRGAVFGEALLRGGPENRELNRFSRGRVRGVIYRTAKAGGLHVTLSAP